MTIRHATAADAGDIVRMSLAFLTVEPYASLVHNHRVGLEGRLEGLVSFVFSLGDSGVIFLAEDDGGIFGMLAIVGVTHPLTGANYGEELAWWVDLGQRGRRAGPKMLRSAERWAVARGLIGVKLIAPIPSTVGTFYERCGWTATETAYMKTF